MYLNRYDALHLDHSISQSFDLLVLHVVLQLHLLQKSHTFSSAPLAPSSGCEQNKLSITHLQNICQLIDVSLQIVHASLLSTFHCLSSSTTTTSSSSTSTSSLFSGRAPLLSDAHSVADVLGHGPPALPLVGVLLGVHAAQLLHFDDGERLDLLTGVTEVSQSHLKGRHTQRNSLKKKKKENIKMLLL